MPKCSVIVATHNRPHLLPRAVESAQRAGAEVEVVVVDDASSEETAAVCGRLHGIRYVRVERNQQVAGARNLGLIAGTGDYVSFLDDDDLRLPGSIDMQIKALEAAPEAGLVYGRAFHGGAGGETLQTCYPALCPHGDVFWALLEWNFIPCPAVVFRRACLYRVGLLDDASPGVEDWDLWLRIAELYPVVAVETPVAVWRQASPTSGQASSRASEMLSLCAELFDERWLALPRASAAPTGRRREVRRRFLNGVIDQLIWETARSIRCGALAQARKNIATALRLSPKLALRKGASAHTLNFLLNGALGKWRVSAVGAGRPPNQSS